MDAVSKRYVRRAPRPATLKSLARHPFASRGSDGFWALRDVTVAVDQGETLGLIGANGSGKSTLLRLIGGVGRPTSGRITTTRKIDAILSLGDGLDPYLTGRENAITAGILGGLRRREIVERLDEIAEFAELGDFFDRPLRTYSEGMKLRLAFAATTTIQPDILLIDEVLSVGDVGFQEKCFQRLEEMQSRGAAVILATHDDTHVERLCDRVAWLRDGTVVVQGPAGDVLHAYQDWMHSLADEHVRERTLEPEADVGEIDRSGTFEVEIAAVRVTPSVLSDESTPVRVELDLVPHVPVRDPIVSVTMLRRPDLTAVMDLNSQLDGVAVGLLDAPRTVTLELDRVALQPGEYGISVGLFQDDWEVTYDYHWNAYRFEVPPGLRSSRRWT